MKFDVKKAIIDTLRATQRKNIEKVIEHMEGNGFFTYHCHRHHHYDGGLADHAWQTYQIALRIEKEYAKHNPDAPKLDRDSIAIACLLHDFCGCSGMPEIRKAHGLRSVVMLLELGLKLTDEEYLAIRFHMSLRNKDDHPLYKDALHCRLRKLVHYSDGKSAGMHSGCDDLDNQPEEQTADLQQYLVNITKLDYKDLIYKVEDGWLMNIHSPYTGEINDDVKRKIIGVKEYDTAELCGLNDSMVGAVFILERGGKKALFLIHDYFGYQGGYYFSPDKEPFIYSEIKLYADWNNWEEITGYSKDRSSYGYAACKQHNGWKLVKLTQFPKSEYTVLAEGFSSAEEAMKSIGIEDSDKYLHDALFH